jgi:hypothetical protein
LDIIQQSLEDMEEINKKYPAETAYLLSDIEHGKRLKKLIQHIFTFHRIEGTLFESVYGRAPSVGFLDSSDSDGQSEKSSDVFIIVFTIRD